MVAALEVRLRHRLSRLDLDVDFAVGEETLALVGPSGAGKSTILRAVAGLMHPQSGRVVSRSRVFLDTEQGVDIAPEDRHVGMVFQDGALFPFMSVLANVAYGVRADRRERERKALAVLERFGISALATARPASASGSHSPAQSPRSRRSFCSMNPFRRSTRRLAPTSPRNWAFDSPN
jgi:molybdate transport system ATP-binding protein